MFPQEHVKIIREYDPYTATVCALYFVFGAVCAFFGYRCFKALMFLYGFIFGSIVVYLICVEEKVLPEWSNAAIAMSAGLLFGLITMLVQYVGLFMLGFHTGVLSVLSSSLHVSLTLFSVQGCWAGWWACAAWSCTTPRPRPGSPWGSSSPPGWSSLSSLSTFR